MDEDLAKSFGLEEKAGILISQIMEDSAAEEAGLKEGDIVVKMNGKAVGRTAAFRNRVAATPPNTKVKLRIFRNGKYKNISAITKAMEGGGHAQPELLEKIGISIDDTDGETGRHLRRQRKPGVLVTEVDQGSPAWRAGLQPGQVIAGVDRKPVESVDEFLKALSESDGKRILFLVSDGRSSRFVVVNLEE